MTSGDPTLPAELRRQLDQLAQGADDRQRLTADVDEVRAVHSQHHAAIDSWFASVVGDTSDPTGNVAQPKTIGPYELVRRLGEGGMGTVWLAQQHQPLERQVALKVIKLGMNSRAIVARFEQERQALARMQHDGIARVFDCGTTERGQPYFVMEYVQGVPLTDYCDDHRLSLVQRIRLLQQVCAAVTHAHQKGVLHRDLKPSNVLVTADAGRVQVKVIDFGLAKAIDKGLSETPLLTEEGLFVGTPEYSAPEQADPGSIDIDTRADVYSLGVMLYELLVGELPFSSHDLRRAGIAEVQRILREVEPQKPSTRLSSSANQAAIAGSRHMTPSSLRRVLRQDLDWVVVKALEKDRARRYDTANALAMDLQRFLDHEPLQAGPPSTAYRLKKLVRRYRGQVAAASAVLVALVAGLAIAWWQWGVAKENERLAKRNLDRFLQMRDVPIVQDLLREADEDLWPAHPDKVARMGRWLERARAIEARLPEHRAALAELGGKALPMSDELREDRFLHQTLGELVGNIERLVDPQTGQLVSVAARQRQAETLAERSIGDEKGSEAARSLASAWRAAAGRVAKDPRFAEFILRPQLGLVPLGPDPASKLEEFAHLLSGEPPVRDEEGKIVIEDETGIVLVLIPGGTFLMGAQKRHPAQPNYDPLAEVDEWPVHEVELEPYLLAKHEMTQGQWLRIAGEHASGYGLGKTVGGHAVTLCNPVEDVSWNDCVRMLGRLGLVLPREEQWERAARAGTDTPWWTGEEKASLAGAGNVADAYCKANGGSPKWRYDEDLDDGHTVHAPVGSFRANPFGLWDVIGNVYEWCSDSFAGYGEHAPRAGDGGRNVSGARDRVFRDSSWGSIASFARSAARRRMRAADSNANLGCRPAGIIAH